MNTPYSWRTATYVTSFSHPIDLSIVNERLLDPAFDRDVPSRSKPRPDTPASRVPGTCRRNRKERECISYNELLEQGGRPLYPIERIHDVAEDPASRWGMLRPWLRDPSRPALGDKWVDWDVFCIQSEDWCNFRRRWQVYNRAEEPSGYKFGQGWEWKAFVSFNNSFRDASTSYTQAAQKLLLKHDFHRSFEFQHSTAQQDELTTWIEYLCFQYAMCHRIEHILEERQPSHEQAWKSLNKMGVLPPSKTVVPTYFYSDWHRKYEYQREERELEAAEVVHSARRAVADLDKEHVRTTHGSQIKRNAVYDRAARRLKRNITKAEAMLRSIGTRNKREANFIAEITAFRGLEEELEPYKRRTQWVFDQVVVVASELCPPEAGSMDPSPGPGRSRKPARSEEPGGGDALYSDNGRPLKRLKQ